MFMWIWISLLGSRGNASQCQDIMNELREKITQGYHPSELLMHAYAGHFIADWVFATEKFAMPPVRGQTAVILSNITFFLHNVKSVDSVYVNVDSLGAFKIQILDHLPVPILLVTGQWGSPQLFISNLSISILHHKRVAYWFSQNPIFNHVKYRGFIYGLSPFPNEELMNIFFTRGCNTNRTKRVYASYASVDARRHHRAGTPMGENLSRQNFYLALTDSQFVLSVTGDRPDTFRHAECILFGAIPVADVFPSYLSIYGDNMIVLPSPVDLRTLLENNTELGKWQLPDLRILLISTWRQRIRLIQNVIQKRSNKTTDYFRWPSIEYEHAKQTLELLDYVG
eukprot:gb/GEZN01009447.1/.p1 GENE.gb/GEZN01009447.1/~~gb/GEZN01009447.1/.p1  ORF type:complete len:349 (-),score=-6.74 gb/GEZN01009447.1/:281-1300(-)